MNLREVLKGTRARKTVLLDVSGEKVAVDLRVLATIEYADVLERARAFAKARGVEDPSDGNPLYDFGIQVETLAIAILDSEKPKDFAPFFASSKQILEADVLTRDHIAYLFAHYEVFASEQSPLRGELDKADFLRLIAKSAEGDFGPFCSLQPATQWASFRSLAVLFLSSPTANSQSTLPS